MPAKTRPHQTILNVSSLNLFPMTTTNFEKIGRGKRVRLVRNMADMTINDFASKIGVSSRTVKYWENGETGKLSEKGAEKIIKSCRNIGLQCNLVWLLHGFGAQPTLIDPSYKKFILFSSQDDQTLNETIDKEIHFFHSNNEDAITTKISDDGMEPYLTIGDVAGGTRKRGKDLTKLLHKNCIIEIKNGQTLCRHLLHGSQPNLFNLCCINQKTNEPFVIADVEIISAAPITWIRKQE